MSYQPLYISAYQTGLVQSRQNFLLPNDAYPTLENAFVFRERIQRKSGCRLLGRLRRVIEDQADASFVLDGGGAYSGNLKSILSLETNSELEVSSVSVSDGVGTWSDNGDGTLTGTGGRTGTINYSTMALTLSGGAGGANFTVSFNYYPNLPAMGIRQRELDDINSEQMIVFDQTYAYKYTSAFEEFIPGTTWSGNDSDFFWSTNYWVGDNNRKIFWVTNFSGVLGDPIRYTNGVQWVDFNPIIDSETPTPNRLQQCLCMLPFRGRMVVFNTFEGQTLATSVQYRQRIRWAAIGNPFTEVAAGVVTTISADAWKDDIRGKGGFLDIPTAEDIVSVGFVRDNLVIFCESSTWQLRYTGRAIAPFQIEKVNTELGAESTFSAVQFDTSLVGVGDKGIIECDSYKADRIDIKIPDQVFNFNNDNNGTKRVHGIRDYQQRVAYWTYPTADSNVTYPNRRLLYNYENDSWATFIDSYTCLGFNQPQQGKRWIDFPTTDDQNTWENANFPWQSMPSKFPAIVGGNQQGFVEYLGQQGEETQVGNDASLYILDITGRGPNLATRINSPNHNLEDNQIIEIENIPAGTPFASSLNNGIFRVDVIDLNNFDLYTYTLSTKSFSEPQLDDPATYVGGGRISVRDNINIVSKKFNFIDQGQNIMLGYMDILMNNTTDGAISMNVYMDYNDTQPINTYPQNVIQGTSDPDTFFNTVIPTFAEVPLNSTKNWQRIYCSCRGGFLTLQFTFSETQMAGQEQENDVQIDSQILWIRPAGTQLTRGV